MNIITAFQVGDRLELGVRDESLQQGLLPLEPALSGFFGQSDVAVVIDHTPEPIRLRYDAASGALQSAQLRPSLEVKLLYEPSWGTCKGNVVSCHCDRYFATTLRDMPRGYCRGFLKSCLPAATT